MFCMRLELRGGGGRGVAVVLRKPHPGNLPLGQMKEGIGQAAQPHRKQSQVHMCQNANLVSLMIIFPIFDRETTHMYSQTLDTDTLTQTHIL